MSELKSINIYADPIINPNCSEFEINGYTISEFIIKELVPVIGIHPYPLNELFLMVSSICRLKPTHIFEWGTNVGISARIFFEISQKFGINSEIHSIDLPDSIEHAEHPHYNRGKFVKGIKGVKLYQGDGLAKSLEICANIDKDFNALFFIDGDHGYGTVKRELTAIIEAVPGANILLHDTFYQSSESGYYIGPYQAIVDTLTDMPDKYSVISTNMCLPGMTLLYKLFELI